MTSHRSSLSLRWPNGKSSSSLKQAYLRKLSVIGSLRLCKMSSLSPAIKPRRRLPSPPRPATVSSTPPDPGHFPPSHEQEPPCNAVGSKLQASTRHSNQRNPRWLGDWAPPSRAFRPESPASRSLAAQSSCSPPKCSQTPSAGSSARFFLPGGLPPARSSRLRY